MSVMPLKDLLMYSRDAVFVGQAPKETLEFLQDTGITGLAKSDLVNQRSGIFDLLLRVYLAKVIRPNPTIPKTFEKVVERMSNPTGALQQRIKSYLMKGINPQFKNLTNYGSSDPFVRRFPTLTQGFWNQNFDWSNHMTLQDVDLQKYFTNAQDIPRVIADILANFDDAWRLTEATLIDEMFNMMLNNNEHPLKNSQIIETGEINLDNNNNDIMKFFGVFVGLYNEMKATKISGRYNAMGYEHGVNPEDMVLFIRQDQETTIDLSVRSTLFREKYLKDKFETVMVNNFGGISYSKTVEGAEVPMLPCYSTNEGEEGCVLGYNADGDPTKTMYQKEELNIVDPNKDVTAVLVQKGALFISEQNSYISNSIFNPRDLTTNYWVHKPNMTCGYDACYDVIKFVKGETQAPAPSEPSEPSEP